MEKINIKKKKKKKRKKEKKWQKVSEREKNRW
jgi:hypothetical protein